MSLWEMPPGQELVGLRMPQSAALSSCRHELGGHLGRIGVVFSGFEGVE